jgi:hypothetical protein
MSVARSKVPAPRGRSERSAAPTARCHRSALCSSRAVPGRRDTPRPGDPTGRDEQFESLYLLLVEANPFQPSDQPCRRAQLRLLRGERRRPKPESVWDMSEPLGERLAPMGRDAVERACEDAASEPSSTWGVRRRCRIRGRSRFRPWHPGAVLVPAAVAARAPCRGGRERGRRSGRAGTGCGADEPGVAGTGGGRGWVRSVNAWVSAPAATSRAAAW